VRKGDEIGCLAALSLFPSLEVEPDAESALVQVSQHGADGIKAVE
jgi:hypothetical protein